MTPEERERFETHRWQAQAARVLVALEDEAAEAAEADLPGLDWAVGLMRLTGTPAPGRSAEQARADWLAWAEHLGAVAEDESVLSTGTRILRATAERRPGSGPATVTVLLLAEIQAED